MEDLSNQGKKNGCLTFSFVEKREKRTNFISTLIIIFFYIFLKTNI